MRMNFILPHSFELDLRGNQCLVHWSSSFLVIQISCSVQKFSSLESPSADLFELPEDLYLTDCSVIRIIWCSRLAQFLLCFYTGETSRLWWASVLLLSDPRQSVHTVRVPYQPSVFAPSFLKSAGWDLFWSSAVLVWFLALLYPEDAALSIRRLHKEMNSLFQDITKKLWKHIKIL